MLRMNFKLALRNLVRQKGYTAINVVGLAVALAFALLILFWVRYECGVDRHHDNIDVIYLVAFSGDDGNFHSEYTVGALGPHIRDTYPEITHATRYSPAPPIPFGYEDEQYTGVGRFVDPDFLSIFSFDFLEGNLESAFGTPLSIVLTRSMARRIFGDSEGLGQELKIRDQQFATVGAVIDDPPATSRFQFDLLLNCALNPISFSKWDIKSLKNYIMLAPGADPKLVSEKISNVYNDHNPGTYPNYQYLFPLRDLHLYGLKGEGRIQYVQMFSILAVIVLLIASVNFMNLSTARAATRFREIGLKKVLGAGRGQIALQFMIEAGIVTMSATVLAVALVEAFLPGLNGITGAQVSLDFSWSIMGLLLGVAVITTLLAGSYPALYLSSFCPANVLRGVVAPFGIEKAARGKRSRQVLVVLQFAASIALVVGVMGIFGQLNYILSMDLGFNKDNVVIFDIPRQAGGQVKAIKNELLRNPDIQSVTVSRMSLIRWQSSMGIDWEGKDPANTFDVGRNWVDHDYAETFQIEMVDGRFFSPEITSDLHDAVVIKEACVRAMGITDPVGRTITIGRLSSEEATATVIGVMRDHRTESAHSEIRPFLLELTNGGGKICARINPDRVRASIDFMRQTMSDFTPGADYSFRFYDDMVPLLYRDEMLTGAVVGYVTLIAIFISCLGLLGLAAFTARQRAKEMSIRKVLGASVGSIVGLLSREFLILMILAGAIASPIAWYTMNNWLERFAYRITIGPWIFLSATVVACLIGLAAVTGQAFRVATSNPAKTLREE